MRMEVRRRPTTLAALALCGMLASGCGGGESGQETEAGPAEDAATEEGTRLVPPAPEELAAAADQGEQLFQTKGCVGCHAIGGPTMSAPDLQGVTERRPFAWITSMVTAPDSMTRDDPEARALLGQYLVQMPTLGITEAEARALYAYLHGAVPSS